MSQHPLAGRLPFQLQDFTRLIWHSAAARDVWAPRLSRINAMWSTVERLAVLEGIRNACLTFFAPADLIEASHLAAKSDRDVVVLPLMMTGMTTQYSSTSKAVVAGQPWHYRAVMVRRSDAPAWVDAWKNGVVDDAAVGRLLGYPECCRAFFNEVWVDGKGVDTTWQMAANTDGVQRRDWERGTELRLKADALLPGANIMLRWLGVRLVPHLPCSHTCAATAAQADAFAELAIKSGFVDEIAWVREMLDWPIEWSALHGVAEIRTPVCTLSTRTDATQGNMVVQREGHTYPDEGARGLRFPFKQDVEPRVTSKPAFARAFAEPSTPVPVWAQPVWTRNGFGSETAMDAAHDIVLNVLPDPAEGTGKTLLDFGCGNGRLLEKAVARGWRGRGLELDPARCVDAIVPVIAADMFDLDAWRKFANPDTALIMPGRLLEHPTKAAAFLDVITTTVRQVIIYAYGDWLAETDVISLGAKAGFTTDAWTIVAQVKGSSAGAALLVRTSTA